MNRACLYFSSELLNYLVVDNVAHKQLLATIKG